MAGEMPEPEGVVVEGRLPLQAVAEAHSVNQGRELFKSHEHIRKLRAQLAEATNHVQRLVERLQKEMRLSNYYSNETYAARQEAEAWLERQKDA